MTKYRDATGYPVVPTENRTTRRGYWYRTDTLIEPKGGLWGGLRWRAVQDLFEHPDYPHTDKMNWHDEYEADTSREIAFEVGSPHFPVDQPTTEDHRLPLE